MRITETARMESSISCREPASSATMKRNSSLSLGNWYQTNDQINFGGHTQRFAYYASVNGNRSDYGLQTPIGQVVHDAENGYGGFASFIFNASSSNQFRLVASLRQDYYQIPFDPNPNSAGNQSMATAPSYGLHDSEREPDGYVTFSWVHTFNPNLLLTVSPFYHYNQASYNGSPERFSGDHDRESDCQLRRASSEP